MALPAASARVPTFATYATAWLLTHRERISPGTYVAYEVVLRRWLAPFAPRPLVTITRADVKALLAGVLHTGVAWHTARHVLIVLRACLAAAVDDGILDANPAASVGRQALGPMWYRRPPRALDADELHRLLAVPNPCADVFLVLARTGLRIGEALGLQAGDWNASERLLTVTRQWRRGSVVLGTKTRRSRVVEVSAQAAVVLTRRSPRASWLFPGPHGVPLNEATVRYHLREILGRAGIAGRVSLHTFRHTFASQLVANGAPLAWVQRQLGHSSIRTTVDTYGRHLPMRGLAYVDALDG